jgi:DtxR family Mn-dependent transcriptional regulator
MLTRKEEDYLEVIYNLSKEKGYARIKDISKILDVKPPSAVEMARKLSNKSLINYLKNEPLKLTDKGLKIAKLVNTKHETFRNFFKILLVPEDIAKKDSFKIEHNLHTLTITQLQRFVEFFYQNLSSYKNFHDKFKLFCEKEKD